MSKTIISLFLASLIPAFPQNPAAATTLESAVPGAPANQRRVDPASMYHRVYAVVPIIGSGKKDDPFRPMFIPTAAPAVAEHAGIIAWQMQVSDDGKSALVEFVSATRADILPVIESTAAGVLSFERGTATQAQIETAFQQYKKNFKLSLFSTRAQ